MMNEPGQQGKRISLSLSMIEQQGDDPAVGKAAADTVKAIGSPQQVEQAYAALATHFPADARVGLERGEARCAGEQAVSALDAYRFAAKADPGNADTAHAVARVEEILRLDPTRRGILSHPGRHHRLSRAGARPACLAVPLLPVSTQWRAGGAALLPRCQRARFHGARGGT